MEIIYKKQDQKIRDQLRGILKMLMINMSMFNQDGARIWELDTKEEVIRRVSNHFVAVSEKGKFMSEGLRSDNW